MAHEGLLPFKYVVADCLYGHSPDFLDAVDACVGVTTLVAIPADTRCWLQRPRTADKRYRYKGEARAKRVVVAPDSAPRKVAPVQHMRSLGYGEVPALMATLAADRASRLRSCAS